jgi:hypothetical protein
MIAKMWKSWIVPFRKKHMRVLRYDELALLPASRPIEKEHISLRCLLIVANSQHI